MRASPLMAFFGVAACSVTGCFHDFDEPFSGSGAGGSGASSTGGDDPSGGGGSNPNGGAPQGGAPNGGSAEGGGGSTADTMDCMGGEVCVTVPDGWQGPVRYFAGAGVRPECGATPLVDAFTGTITAPDATCGGCFCGSATGATCGPAIVNFYDYNDICNAGGPISETVTVTTTCQSLSNPDLIDGSASAKAMPVVVTPGSCTPNGGGVLTLPQASWSENARICTPDAGGAPCGNGGTCVAPAADPFQGGTCVAAQGDLECPAGYGDRSVFYEDLVDGRDCTPCTCNTPTNAACNVDFRAWGSNACGGGGSFPFNDDATCEGGSIQIGAFSVRIQNQSINQGNCAPQQAQPTGEATAGGPWTVCCL